MLIPDRSFSKDRSLCLAAVLRLKRPSSELPLMTALARQAGLEREDTGVCTKSSLKAHHLAKPWISRLKGGTPPAAVG